MAEAAIRAGLDAYFGYPITPQSEVMEYLTEQIPVRRGLVLQAESEVASINMAYGVCRCQGYDIIVQSRYEFDAGRNFIYRKCTTSMPARKCYAWRSRFGNDSSPHRVTISRL